MGRPRRNGEPPAAPRKAKLTDSYIRSLKPQAKPFAVWDTRQPGLCVLTQPSGHRAFKFVYSHKGRARWYNLGNAAIPVVEARRMAAAALLKVVQGGDPQADRKAERQGSSFAELHTVYVEQYAKKKNRSWRQADALVRKHLIPKWGKLAADSISRSDVKAMMARIDAPIVANAVLAAASAVFSFGIREDVLKVNPCQQVERNETRSRERVLSDSEIPLFWREFETVFEGPLLKMCLLLGQRSGEVRLMRTEHIVDGWWELPGKPVPSLSWLGTKNSESHRVWLPQEAQAILAAQDARGFVFEGARGKPIDRTRLAAVMRSISKKLEVEPARPHDLRRTHGTLVTSLGHGRPAMNRIQNHAEGGISGVYDRFGYSDENKRVMEAVANKITSLVEGKQADNVVTFGR